MKGKKRLWKKALSLFLTVVMLMTCWVFFAPTKADAASAGSYVIKITYDIVDGNTLKNAYKGKGKDNNDSCGISVFYKDTNGTATTAKEELIDLHTDLSNNKGSAYGRTVTRTLSGFPYEIYAELNDNWFLSTGSTIMQIIEIQIGSSSSSLKTVWTGKGYLNDSNKGKNIYINQTTQGGNDSKYGYVNTSTRDWPTPAATTITGLADQTITVPKTNATVTSNALTGVVKDQYGVNWYQAPASYTLTNAKGTAMTSNPKLNTSGDGRTISASTACLTSTNGYNTTTGQAKFTLKATRENATQSVTITVKSPTYYVYFYDGDDNQIASKSCYYNGSVTAPTSADKSPDATNHYQFSGSWDKGYTGIKSDTAINAKFNAIAHTFQYANNNDRTHQVSCTGCSYTTAEEHDYAVTTINAQCEIDGSKNYKCTKCGDSYSETLTATGHNFTGAAKSHLNGKDGDHYYKCVNTNCNEYGVGTTKNATEPHTWDAGVVTKDSTCDVLGIKTYTCTVCGATYTEDIPVKGHTLQKVDYKAPTCTATGNQEYYVCTVAGCGKVFSDAAATTATTVEKMTIAATGHDYTGDIHSLGNGTHNWACKNGCGTYGNGTTENAYISCAYGSNTYKDENVHAKYCACGYSTGDTAHDWKSINVVAATCSKTGTETFKCAGCAATKDETLPIDPTAHKYGSWVVDIPAECEKPGQDKRVCEYDESHVDTRETAALVHDYSAKTVDPAYLVSDASCTAPAKYYVSCSLCGKSSQGTDKEATFTDGDALGHDWGDYTITEATHSRTCKRCGDVDSGSHSYKDVITKPTCTTDGYTTHTCTVCGRVYVDTPVTKLGHDYTEKIVDDAHLKSEADCTTSKIYYFDCSRCEANAKDDPDAQDMTFFEGAPLGHDVGNWTYNNDATCFADGTETGHCSRCNLDVTRTATGTKLTHSFTDYVLDGNANCLADGTETATCDHGCGTTHTRTAVDSHLDPSLHVRVNVIGSYVAPTCTTAGKEYDIMCSVCKKVLETGAEISALGHDYTEELPNLVHLKSEADCETAATYFYDCSRCDMNAKNDPDAQDATFTVGDPLGHDKIQIVEAKYLKEAPTCTSKAVYGYGCTRCDKVLDETFEYGIIRGHAFNTYVYDNNATCFKNGTETAHCDNDGCTATDTRIVTGSKLKHEFTDYTSNNNATCKDDGTKTAYCNHNCGTTSTIRDVDSHLSVAHTVGTEVEVLVPATCTEEGKGRSFCAVCGLEFNPAIPVDANAHLWDEGTLTRPVYDEATGTWSEGTITYTCQRDASHVRTENTVRADYTEYDAIVSELEAIVESGKLTEKGNKMITDALDRYAVADNLVAAEQPVVDAAANALKAIKEEIEIGINNGTIVRPDFTGFDAAVDEFNTYDCADNIKEKVESIKEAVDIIRDDPTSTKKNDQKKVDEYEAEVRAIIDSLTRCLRGEHEFSSTFTVDKESTCTEKGSKSKHCIYCGEKSEATELPLKAHQYGEWSVKIPASCDVKGVEARYCVVCNDEQTRESAALEHEWSAWTVTVEATCQHGGQEKSVCANCGAEQTRATAKSDHHIVVIPAVKATCETDGSTEGRYCADCGTVFKEVEKVPATGHGDYDGDGYCDACGKANEGPCDCICHKNFWLMKIIYKILRFFWKLFGIGHSCSCGATHY